MEEETRFMDCNLECKNFKLHRVLSDLRTMGIKRWRLIAKDRTEWAGIVREAKALQGP
jgi:hypothetical protein